MELIHMTKFNKSLLTAAVVGALALPGLAAAATLQYVPGQQITFAKDLIVNNGTTIYTPDALQLTAVSATDISNIATILAGETVRVKLTLTNGAQFDSTAPAATIVAGFLEGDQTGGGGVALTVVGTPYYSASGQELNFEYTATTAGVVGAPGDYFLQLNSVQITNLVAGLFTGNAVSAEITVQNQAGVQVLAQRAVIARSQWGLAVSDVGGDTNKTIDVGASPRKTWFAPNGIVGESAGTPPGYDYFNAGGFVLDISSAALTGGGGSGYVNNYSAIAVNPEYNVVGTANITVTVAGTNLAAFAAGDAWLDASATCSGVTPVGGTVATGNGSISFTANALHALYNPIASANPGPVTAYVCLAADGSDEIMAQDLAGSITVDYDLPTQRVNPPAMDFTLLPLRLNGTTLIFQNVNPAGNTTAQSFLRLTNNNGQICPVVIDAKDDAGLHSAELSLTLDAHESIQINSEDLESGNAGKGLTGGFGDGTGKWYVRVTAECSNFKASALNRNSDNGVVTNLTPEKFVGNEWLTPDNSL